MEAVYWQSHFSCDSISTKTDDGSSPEIHLLQPFCYFGRTYKQIYVNHNGHITFNGRWSRFVPHKFPARQSRDLIAPFWTDLDNRQNGQIYYSQYTSGSVLQQATQDINQYFPGVNCNATWVFVATWSGVPYYPNAGKGSNFQAVLISGGQKSFVLMNYGVLAETRRIVQAGFDTIKSTQYFSMPRSMTRSATGSRSTFCLNSNVHVNGRWAFQTDSEESKCTFGGKFRGYY
ncbi:sushi, nidogen and EGF-like domain-containing protein 1 [Genypterus blacodes]|uniref:sushi, nidogen and EGF-like domain-containing protein 1 n=1 Tax=Genypterus blacodes TaxID=154954 RepID=UPI003F759827